MGVVAKKMVAFILVFDDSSDCEFGSGKCGGVGGDVVRFDCVCGFEAGIFWRV